MSKELDGNYAAFGKVVKGEELLDKIFKTEVPRPPLPAPASVCGGLLDSLDCSGCVPG